MKADNSKKQRVNIITLGCPKNVYDSEVLLNQIGKNGFDIVHEGEVKDNDTIIINTCGFINDAKEQSVNTILNFAQQKEERKIRELFVIGCLSERYKNELTVEIPEIDKIFGVNHLEGVLSSLKPDYKKELVGEQTLSTPNHFAYLKIGEGCNQSCSFCAIPSFKGIFRSKPMEEVIQNAESLVSQGVKEIILIAQDTTFYGRDLYKKPMLPELVNKISEIDGLEWVRIHYAYPTKFPVELLDVIAKNEKVCKYLDIPLQHISNSVLNRMQRKINKEKTLELLDNIRSRIPNISFRTSFIVGFPGETEEDFDDLYDFIKEQRFDRIGVFTYSHEEGTGAFRYEDDVPEEIKQERMNILMSLQQKVSESINKEKIGQTFKVLIDRKQDEFFVGRTEADSPEVDNEVIIKSDNLEIGEFYQIEVTDAGEYDLIGKVVNGS